MVNISVNDPVAFSGHVGMIKFDKVMGLEVFLLVIKTPDGLGVTKSFLSFQAAKVELINIIQKVKAFK